MSGRVGRLFVCMFIFVLVVGSFAGAGLDNSSSDGDNGNSSENVAVGSEEIPTLNNSKDEKIILNLSDNQSKMDVNFSRNLINDSDFNNDSNSVNNSDDFEYVAIDNLVNSSNLSVGEKLNEKTKNSAPSRLIKDGKIILECENPKNKNIDIREIERKERKLGEFEKEVRLSSKKHFDNEFRVWSDLPKPALKKNILVSWENNKTIIKDINFYDDDSDGLVDRISWIVPHLSTQYYNIEIVVDNNENPTASDIILTTNMPSNGSTVFNPISFNISIEYYNLSKVDCWLRIDNGDLHPFFGINGSNFSGISVIELSSGVRNWIISCSDGLSNVSTSGFFNVSSFSIENINNFYFSGSDISGKVKYQGDASLTNLTIDGETVNLDSSGNFLIRDILIGNHELIASTSYYENEISFSRNFSVGKVTLGFDSNVSENENVVFNIGANNIANLTYDLYVGNNKILGGYGNQSISKSFSKGNYAVSLKNIRINSVSYGNLNFGTLVVGNPSGDSKSPEVDLRFPAWDDVVKFSTIEFDYDVEDNVDVKNCSFKLFNATKGKGGVYETDELIFPLSPSDKTLALKDGLSKKDKVKLKLVDFDEGNYIWEVKCWDSAGNRGWDFNYFRVDFGSKNITSNKEAATYDREDEVKKLIKDVNGFLEKRDDFGPNERKVLDFLGFGKDMNFYKKKLIQLDQDLKFNLRFMTEDKRKVRIREIYDEIDKIREKIILDVQVVDSYEFSKSSVDVDVAGVLDDYFKAEGMSLSKGSLRQLSKFNQKLQGDLGVRVEAWKIKISSFGKDRNIVLVSKNLDFDDDFNGKVLEVVGDDFGTVNFISDARDVGSGIWEIGNIKKDVVYYFSSDDSFDLAKIEKVESLLFVDETEDDGFMLTGFFVGVGDGLSFDSMFWLPFFLFVGYFGFLVFGKVKLEKWKEDPNVSKILDLLDNAGSLLKKNDVEGARDVYLKMNEIYVVLPVKCREFFYNKIARVRLAINKKDVLNLVREYEAAKDDFRRDDAIALHSKINDIYKKLPKKFQERIYRRLVKKEV